MGRRQVFTRDELRLCEANEVAVATQSLARPPDMRAQSQGATALEAIIEARDCGQPLSVSQYALLSARAHAAYARSRRDFVSAKLVRNNIDAFASCIQACTAQVSLRSWHFPEQAFLNHPEDNTGLMVQGNSDILLAVEQTRDWLGNCVNPPRRACERIARNLEAATTDTWGLAPATLDHALRPHLDGLLLLALKAFYYENHCGVSEVEESTEIVCDLQRMVTSNHRNTCFSLSVSDDQSCLSFLLTPSTNRWFLDCDYPRFTDLAHIVSLDCHAQSDHFTWTPADDHRSFRLSAQDGSPGMTLEFSHTQRNALRELVSSVFCEPRYASVLSSQALRYGSI